MGGRMTDKPRIITLDIETVPLTAHIWGMWDQNVGVNQLQEEWSILSVAWKELGQPGVSFMGTQGKPRNDKALCEWLWDVLDDADIVVAQNGIDFDLKKINARMLMHGMGPYSPVRVIDTKRVAQRFFGFTSNRLEWLGEKVAGVPKSSHKKFPGFELWAECLKGNKEAWRELEKYNKQDVLSTEKLYLKLRPWIEGHPNVATYTNGEADQCPKCGSTALEKRGFATTQYGRFQRYRCTQCGGWSRASRTDLPASKKRSLLTN